MKAHIYLITVLALSVSGAVFADPNEDAANREILKRAVQGAITGAVAAEATKDDKEMQKAVEEIAPPSNKKPEAAPHPKKNKKDKKRPYGWDQGKKTGWGESDIPPGQAKKKDK